ERGDNQLIIRRFSPLSCSPPFLGSSEVESYIALRAGGVPVRGGGFASLSALVLWHCRATCAAVHIGWGAESLRSPRQDTVVWLVCR
ncbi:MAG: hypothetical protein IJF48_00880, partial [Clostridia bacterium]|nr:hypothetical protein [Clostridia bacterium]